MENQFYIQQLERKEFKCIHKKLRKEFNYRMIFIFDFKPYHITIIINENLCDDYLKYKWKKPIIKICTNFHKDDIIFNFNHTDCKLNAEINNFMFIKLEKLK